MADIVEFKPAHLVIPEITDPLGKYWEQPKTTDFLISDEYALMDKDTAEALSEYSYTMPTGVYEGKMWRRLEDGVWHLLWYGRSKNPNKCSIEHRKISIRL